jgi:hypothetical protein
MVFGDKVPEDKQNKFNNLMTIAGLTSPIVPKTWIRGELVKLGWEIDEATVAAQLETETQAAADAFNARVNQELNNVAAGAGDGAGPGAGSGSPAGAGAGSNGNGAAAGG